MARRRNKQWRVNGPYEERGGARWRIVIVSPAGDRESVFAKTEDEGDETVALLNRRLLGETLVRDAIGMYADHLRKHGGRRKQGAREVSVKTIVRRLRYVLPVNKLLSEITADDAQGLYDGRVKGRAAATHRHELGYAKRFFAWAVKEKLVEVSPFDAVEPVGTVNRRKDSLRRTEARRFAAVALELASEGEDGALACLALLYLGLRSGELRRLRARDVDGDELWITEGKTDNAERRLALPEPLGSLLREKAKHKGGQEYLFDSWQSTRGHYSRQWLHNWVVAICAKADVPKTCPHGLRATHATLAEDAGASPHFVAKSLGHASHGVTEQHYLEPGTTDRARMRGFLKVLEGGEQNRENGFPKVDREAASG